MIQKKFYKTRTDGVDLYRTYSDTGMMIRQVETGVEYAAAIDVDGANYTYEETDTPIDDGGEDNPFLAVQILLGEEPV